ARDELGIEINYLESTQQTDYGPNITQFIDQDYNIIITVGFLLGEDTATFAEQNPDTNFAIIDYSYDPAYDNVLGLEFSTDQAAFLAGYAAAGVTQTGKVGTFGGIPIPPVTIFMVGFEHGVMYYNEVHGTDVEVLGWDSETGEGVFTGNFDSTDDGRRIGEDLIGEGADIILPVAGPVGLGTAAAVLENPGTMLIGVDADCYLTFPEEYQSIMFVSIMKRVDLAVYEATSLAYNGEFEGGTYFGTLANGGVQLSPFHDFDSMVSAELKAELDEIEQGIINGEINTGWLDYLSTLE
nr:BMP family ABC transporter substrate-binding protein [Anaerolineae bacterium]